MNINEICHICGKTTAEKKEYAGYLCCPECFVKLGNVKHEAPLIQTHPAPDWCHCCGKISQTPLAQATYYISYLQRKKDLIYIRLCANCLKAMTDKILTETFHFSPGERKVFAMSPKAELAL